MASIVRISDAVSIGVHAALCLGSDTRRNWSAQEIVSRYDVSPAHLSKVLQTMVRAGIVLTERGPRGGARLRQRPEEISLLSIYEAIDGPMAMEPCLLASDGCGTKCCSLGTKLARYNDEIREAFASMTLADLVKLQPVPNRPARTVKRE
jgi:Rrf2 family protein